MKRRDFLTKGALAFGGALAGVQVFPRIEKARKAFFSLDVVTAAPDRAIDAVQSLIESSLLGNNTLRFEEHQLLGSHIGDIAFVRGSSLVDFRRSGDALSTRLTRIAHALGLPKQVEDPVLLQFASSGENSVAQELHIYFGDILAERRSLHQNLESHRIENDRGSVDLTISNGTARITAASCKHKTCMKMGTLRRAGQSLVCIPSQIRVAVTGRSHLGVDGIAS